MGESRGRGELLQQALDGRRERRRVRWWTYGCFLWWCSLAGWGASPDESGPIDALEVKCGWSVDSTSKLNQTEQQLRSVSYSAYLPTAVVLTSSEMKVYFEIAQFKSEFRFGG